MKTTNEACGCISLNNNASGLKRKHINNNTTNNKNVQVNTNKRKINTDENKENAYINKANNLNNSLTLNRVVKRLRLNSLSPNVVANSLINGPHSSYSYSSMLASAAAKHCLAATRTPPTSTNSPSSSKVVLKNRELFPSHLFLNENSTSSRDSGISSFSPASCEIQQINANKTRRLTNTERPSLAKENNFDNEGEEEEFSSNDEDSFEYSVSEMDQNYVDDEDNENNKSVSIRLLLSEDSQENDEYRNIFNSHKSNRIISTVNDGEEEEDDENTRDHFSFNKNASRQQLNATSNSQNNSSLSLTGGARRCLFKNSPLNSPSPSYANAITNANAANSTPLNELDQRVILAPLNFNELDQNNEEKTATDSNKAFRQITPISTLRRIINQNPTALSSNEIHDSLQSIERSLEIYASKRKQPQQHPTPLLNDTQIIIEEDEENDHQNNSLILTTITTKAKLKINPGQLNTNENTNQHHELIKTSLEMDQQQPSRLIGDRTRFHILPCINSIKHSDLNVIEPNTLTQVLDGSYSSLIGNVIVIDSRYPYEYDGGHIRHAKNVYTKENLIELFLTNPTLKSSASANKRTIIIFHCEFSSERGPNLLRFLRNEDRAANRDNYPALFYPELYLLEGGYKAFYESHETYCEPRTYKPMLHVDHVMDLKHFRAKTKTWETQHKMSSTTSTGFRRGASSKNENNNGVGSKLRSRIQLQRFPKSTLF